MTGDSCISIVMDLSALVLALKATGQKGRKTLKVTNTYSVSAVTVVLALAV
jgi:hypothetical protein